MSQSSKGQTSSAVTIKAIVIIVVVAIAYQYYIDNFVDEDVISLGHFSYGLSSLAVGIVAFTVAKRYRGSPVFGKTYFALAIGFVLAFVGELVYNYYSMVLFEDPYPSIADVFFIAFYFFAAYHLIKNIKYFKKDLGSGAKLVVPAISIAMIVGFGLFTLETFESNPDVYLMSMAYVVSSAVVLALALLGAAIFRHSVLGVAWLLLAAGIVGYSIADVWYYYLEEIEEYTLTSPVNTLWILSNALMIYALYKHKKTI